MKTGKTRIALKVWNPLRKIIPVVLAGLLFSFQAAAAVTSPEDFLGFKVGADRKVADMHQILEYFGRLDRESERVKILEVGKTTLGNPFIVAVITSEANHRSLAAYRETQQRLADPRRTSEAEARNLIASGKAVVMVNCSIHASEIGASQMSMELAYDLASRNDPATLDILENVILLLVPMHNPDGIQMVVDWYRKNLGTPYEGGPMPWLYHKYVGHDNNRDWYMFTQVESRLTLEVHNAWHPHIVVDMHQMGSRGARLFVPPYVDPYEPNVDPILRQEVAMMGTFIASELTSQGKAGVIHSSRYDAWTPARAYHHYHGGIRILTEAASVRLATPIEIKFEDLAPSVREPSVRMPLPWKGGKWTLRDIVEYDYAAAWAALTNAARLRETWLRNFYRVHEKAVKRAEPPFAFLIHREQKDFAAAVKMMEVLRLGGVEVHRSEEAFTADGRPYPAGTFIIYTAQPYGGFAKALLERQEYPEIRETPGGPLKTPYDVVAHTLPLLMGVEVTAVQEPLRVKSRLLEALPSPEARMSPGEPGFGFVWGHAGNHDIVALNRLSAGGAELFWAAEAFASGGKTYPPGTMIAENRPGLREKLEALAGELFVRFEPLGTRPSIPVYALKPPRVGLYKSWTASMDEGWTRWVMEQYEVPYQSLHDKEIRKGGLEDRFDVIILPDMREAAILNGLPSTVVPAQYAGGIGEVGLENLKTFVKRGGTLITMNGAADFAINRFHLAVENDVAGVSRREFFIPGSILQAINDTTHPLAYGYGRESALFFRRSPAFTVYEGESVVRYPTRPFLSGWVTGEKRLVDKSAVVDVPYEKGRVILIGFPALYRGQAHGTFRYLFNAVYYGAASRETWE